MYQKYWGLQRSIFDSATAREALAQSPVHIEALARLEKAYQLTLANDPAAAEARRTAIEVDSFTLAEYLGAVAEVEPAPAIR